jgi:hypothetical protein
MDWKYNGVPKFINFLGAFKLFKFLNICLAIIGLTGVIAEV